MRVKTWKILDRGDVPLDAATVDFACVHCGREAVLPVVGRPLAQVESGVVFDNDRRGIMPRLIQCRKCGKVLELGGGGVR